MTSLRSWPEAQNTSSRHIKYVHQSGNKKVIELLVNNNTRYAYPQVTPLCLYKLKKKKLLKLILKCKNKLPHSILFYKPDFKDRLWSKVFHLLNQSSNHRLQRHKALLLLPSSKRRLMTAGLPLSRIAPLPYLRS